MADPKLESHARKVGPRENVPTADEYEPPTVDAQVVPDNMSVEQTIEWVSGDQARARAALDAENKTKNPRSSLVASLERLANGQTGAGVQTGEA